MARIKKFVQFCEEFPPPIATQPPTNVADGTNIAGLPPDLPPVPPRKKSKILRRKPPKT